MFPTRKCLSFIGHYFPASEGVIEPSKITPVVIVLLSSVQKQNYIVWVHGHVHVMNAGRILYLTGLLPEECEFELVETQKIV